MTALPQDAAPDAAPAADAVYGGVPGAGILQETFRSRLRYWDSTPRQGLPQTARGRAVYLWRGRDEELASLYTASEPELRAAWDIRSGQAPEHPIGSPLPVPSACMVRGFSLSPCGTWVAALLGPAHSELAAVWLLPTGSGSGVAAELSTVCELPGARSWHAEPVWSAEGSRLWVLDGKPPEQRIVSWAVDSTGNPGPLEALAFPPDISPPGSSAGKRLALRLDGGRLCLRSRQPGGPERRWVHDGASWLPAGRPADNPAGAAQPVQAVELDGVTALLRDGHAPLHLGPAEQLRALSVAGQGQDATLWIHTASPERPSAVSCVPLDGPAWDDAAVRSTSPATTVSQAAGAKLPSGVVHLRLTAPADDGTAIPLIVSARAADVSGESRPREPRPLILTCYGGFGVKHTTECEPSVPAWLDSGGIYVAAQLRGGGELGGEWHEAGRGAGKARTVRDLIDVARFLAAEGWSSPGQTVVVGASHGGLVASAAALQEPGLCAGVVAVAPLLDAVNLERHGLGAQWLHEFGADGECSEEVRAGYSPLHLLQASASLRGGPAMLCCVMGRDERVDNQAAEVFVDGVRSRDGRAWLHREGNGGHAQRAASDVLDFSATVLAFAAAVTAARPASLP